ncbi:hypothetical protein HMPREF1557_01698 [Streptococcus sobrinus W1703]|uniref:Uncharacterized protein n=1 Tax=Streptococcus sobrinus W1703 TaxID=1227275 RepID=U2KB68_9STRE|nr:hypothetical protein HMPREF1557_01698 [Streptococcus sobrinus W1703]
MIAVSQLLHGQEDGFALWSLTKTMMDESNFTNQMSFTKAGDHVKMIYRLVR